MSGRSGTVELEAERYPQAGRAVAVGPLVQDVSVGDLCMIEVESADVAQMYAKVMLIHFTNGDSEMFDLEVEPVIRETVQRYWADSSRDNKITAYTLNGDTIRFDCHDVLTFENAFTSSPEFHLLYPMHVRMFEHEGKLFYVVNEDDILGVIHD